MKVVPIALLFTVVAGRSVPAAETEYRHSRESTAAVETAVVEYVNVAQLPDEWRTHAERTGYEETGRYDEAVAFCRKLADFSPYAKYMSFGTSGEGRELPLLVLSKDRRFEPDVRGRPAQALVRAADSSMQDFALDSRAELVLAAEQRAAGPLSSKPRVLLQCCIHAGECEGKDASLALARDILVTGVHAALLNGLDLLIIPIFNVDGHERFGPYNRLNQNGPREMGWRTTAVNLNLNRDYMKADAVEMQAWLGLWMAWAPDLLLDSHATDGSDCQYDMFYTASIGPGLDSGISEWTQKIYLPELLAGLGADGHLAIDYCFPRDQRDLTKGFATWSGFAPRLSHCYAALCNRPSILVETHSLKPYPRRVQTTYDTMRHTLECVNRHAGELRAAVCAADARAVETRGGETDGAVPLRWRSSEESQPIVYKALEQTFRPSEITGGEVVVYGKKPVDVETVMCNQVCVDQSVTPPAAYLIPPQWSEAIKRFDLHGLEYFRLAEKRALPVRIYEFQNVKFPTRPHEGRFSPKYEVRARDEMREFAAGTVVVPMNQPRAKIAAHLLEPQAPDSFVAWGFFNAIFEQKEYAEAYIMEPLAQRMLDEDAALRQEFVNRLKDADFAGNAGARLNFFYRRSRYWDAAMNVYPVGLLFDASLLSGLR